jgi:hypothetical protein
MVPRLVLRVATPLEFVVALPAALLFSVKLMVCPLTPTAGDPEVRVADKLTVCPKTPDAELTERLVEFCTDSDAAGLVWALPLQVPPLGVAVTENEYAPAGTPLVVETVKVDVLGVLLLAPVTVAGENAGVAPAGRPAALSVTVQATLFPPKFTVTENAVALPATTGLGDCEPTATELMFESVNVFCACNPDWLPTAVK